MCIVHMVCVKSFSKAAIYNILPAVNIFENAHVSILVHEFCVCYCAVKTFMVIQNEHC